MKPDRSVANIHPRGVKARSQGWFSPLTYVWTRNEEGTRRSGAGAAAGDGVAGACAVAGGVMGTSVSAVAVAAPRASSRSRLVVRIERIAFPPIPRLRPPGAHATCPALGGARGGALGSASHGRTPGRTGRRRDRRESGT